MEKKLFAIDCDNVILVVRPNGDTVIMTEAAELVLNNAVMERLVRNSGAYKSVMSDKGKLLEELERDNTELQTTIVSLREAFETVKADRDKLQNTIADLKGELENVKSANNNDDVSRLKRERIKLRNDIMRLERELEEAKADKDSLQQKLVNATIGVQPLAKGYAVNIGNLTQGTLDYLFDIDAILLQIVEQINVLK